MTHITFLDEALKSDPGRLHEALKSDPGRLAFYRFDIMLLDGLDMRHRPFLDRRTALAEVLARPPGPVLYSDQLACDGCA